MHWNKEDLQQYLEAKEYIDTVLIPLVPLTFLKDEDILRSAAQGESIRIFTRELEKEFKGRIILSPEYTYLSTADKQKEVERIYEWIANIKTQPFEHVFFLTFDSQWKKHEKTMEGTVIWLPGMGSVETPKEEIQATVKRQLADLKEFIQSYWT